MLVTMRTMLHPLEVMDTSPNSNQQVTDHIKVMEASKAVDAVITLGVLVDTQVWMHADFSPATIRDLALVTIHMEDGGLIELFYHWRC